MGGATNVKCRKFTCKSEVIRPLRHFTFIAFTGALVVQILVVGDSI